MHVRFDLSVNRVALNFAKLKWRMWIKIAVSGFHDREVVNIANGKRRRWESGERSPRGYVMHLRFDVTVSVNRML